MSSNSDVKMANSKTESAASYGLPDDEVIAEIPVYMSERISKNLHMLQYPLRAGLIRPGMLDPRAARIKPKHGQIEMDIALDVNSPMYNKERGRELGVGLSDTGRILDIQTAVSVDIPKNSNYMAGILREGELHITPIEKVTQLRPSLKYLDRVAEKELAASKLDDDDDEEEEKDAKAQTVQVSVRSAQAEEAIRAQQNSIAFMQKRLEEEPWSALAYYDVGSDESNSVYTRIFAQNTEPLVCKTTPTEFLDTIILGPSTEKSESAE